MKIRTNKNEILHTYIEYFMIYNKNWSMQKILQDNWYCINYNICEILQVLNTQKEE